MEKSCMKIRSPHGLNHMLIITALKIDFRAASLMSENTGSDLSKIDSNLKNFYLPLATIKQSLQMISKYTSVSTKNSITLS